MGKIKSFLGVVSLIVKYAVIVKIVVETIEFFKDKCDAAFANEIEVKDEVISK